MQDTTLTFLVANMKAMEIELRSRSIYPHALGRGIVKTPQQRLDAKAPSRTAKDVAECIELTHASDFLH